MVANDEEVSGEADLRGELTKEYQRLRRINRRIEIVCYSAAAIFMIYAITSKKHNLELVWKCNIVLFLGFIISYKISYHTYARRYRQLLNSIFQTHNVRWLPILVDASTQMWSDKIPELERTIIELSNRVTLQDAGLLTDRQQRNLWACGFSRILNDHYGCGWRVDLAIAVMRILSQIGNTHMLEAVRGISRKKGVSTSTRYKAAQAERLAEAALSLLPIYEARLAAQQVPATLLRAAAQPSEPTSVLLRPADAVHPATTSPEELLRPNDTDQQISGRA